MTTPAAVRSHGLAGSTWSSSGIGWPRSRGRRSAAGSTPDGTLRSAHHPISTTVTAGQNPRPQTIESEGEQGGGDAERREQVAGVAAAAAGHVLGDGDDDDEHDGDAQRRAPGG